jgi:hypothetical protein
MFINYWRINAPAATEHFETQFMTPQNKNWSYGSTASFFIAHNNHIEALNRAFKFLLPPKSLGSAVALMGDWSARYLNDVSKSKDPTSENFEESGWNHKVKPAHSFWWNMQQWVSNHASTCVQGPTGPDSKLPDAYVVIETDYFESQVPGATPHANQDHNDLGFTGEIATEFLRVYVENDYEDLAHYAHFKSNVFILEKIPNHENPASFVSPFSCTCVHFTVNLHCIHSCGVALGKGLIVMNQHAALTVRTRGRPAQRLAGAFRRQPLSLCNVKPMGVLGGPGCLGAPLPQGAPPQGLPLPQGAPPQGVFPCLKVRPLKVLPQGLGRGVCPPGLLGGLPHSGRTQRNSASVYRRSRTTK